jgi:hypothetical protein
VGGERGGGVAALAPQNICQNPSVRRVRVLGAEKPRDRVPGAEGVNVSISVEFRVVSDYFFIGSGRESFAGLEKAARTQPQSFEDAVSLARRMQGARPVKDFYRVLNPFTGRKQPAIPGSSVKGAVRSRIELACRDGKDGKVVAPILLPPNNQGIPRSLPPKGAHGWRHARIWCESVFEVREPEKIPTILEDLFGLASPDLSMQSRVLFNTFYPVDEGLDCNPVELDHGEVLCAVGKGAAFRGTIIVYNASPEDLGLLLYGLGQDKLLCGKEPRLLMGYSKYRCRTSTRRTVSFGIVSVKINEIKPDPLSEDKWINMIEEIGVRDRSSIEEIVRALVEKTLATYPGLPRCFDEAERRLQLEPC